MRAKHEIFIFIFLYLTAISFAQSKNAIFGFTDYEYGAAIESSVLISHKNYSDFWKEGTSWDFYHVSLYLHGTVYFTKNIGVEIKPGWFFGGDTFSAFELALFLKKRFFEKRIIGKIGANFHKNIEYAHGTFQSTDKSVFMFAAVIGYIPKPNWFSENKICCHCEECFLRQLARLCF